MLGDLSSSLYQLDEETRIKLARLLEQRNEYLTELINLNNLRTFMLTHPSAAAEERVNDFNATVVAPLRDGMKDDMFALMDEAVNVDAIKGILPMLLMGLMQSINVSLALTTLGLEPDMVEKLVGEISKFMKSGM